MEKEVWKEYTVPDTGKKFMISSFGNVKHIDEHGKVYTHSNYKNNGYRCIPYKKSNGKNGLIYLHKVMAELFLENPHGFKRLRFKNGRPENCFVHNLEWVSPEEARRMRQQQRSPFDIYENYAPNSKLTPSKVALIKKRALINEKTKKTSWTKMARQFGITTRHLASIRRNEIWQNVQPME